MCKPLAAMFLALLATSAAHAAGAQLPTPASTASPLDIAAAQAAADASPAAQAPAEEKLICRNIRVTGTRHAKRECLTKSESDARATAAREAARDSQRLDCAVGEGRSCGMDATQFRQGGGYRDP